LGTSAGIDDGRSAVGLNDNVIAFQASIADHRSMQRTRHVWFVACPDTELLDLSGPWAVLGYANEVTQRRAYALQLLTPFGGDIRTRHGLVLSGGQPLPTMAAQAIPDVLVIAGSSRAMPLSKAETRLVSWLREHQRRIPEIVSICTGAFVLGEAGLLDRRRATTHWQYVDLLQRRFPKARVVDEEIFLRDGRIWTSAGITAGIDLMLAIVEQDHGHAVAMSVAKGLVLFLRRSGRQAQFSSVLKHQERDSGPLGDLSAFIMEHLDEPLGLERLAGAMALTPRTLTRRCRTEFDEAPASRVRRIRLEEAQRLLEQTTLPLKTIAQRTGLGDPSTVWRVFKREFGITPAEYRARFSLASAGHR
jgi:transcriptional regulator GlxA family with amidase domain